MRELRPLYFEETNPQLRKTNDKYSENILRETILRIIQ